MGGEPDLIISYPRFGGKFVGSSFKCLLGKWVRLLAGSSLTSVSGLSLQGVGAMSVQVVGMCRLILGIVDGWLLFRTFCLSSVTGKPGLRFQIFSSSVSFLYLQDAKPRTRS